MLNVLRKNAGSWMIKVLLGAIVVVFVFWGVGSFNERGASVVAHVNGQPLTMEAYQQAYNMMLDRLRQQFGDNLSEDMLKMFNIRQQALNQIIDQRLMLDEAEALDFKVSNEELIRFVQGIPAFQRDGVFDSRMYQRVLNLNQLTPETFEAMQADSMLVEKLRNFVVETAKVSDIEALEWYNWNNTEVDVDYVLFKPDNAAEVDIDDQQLADYFDKHKARYQIAPRLKADYLVFTPDQFKNQVEIANDVIREYYEMHEDQFHHPKTVEARHILLKLDPDASDEKQAERKKEIDLILEKARAGEDFAELAKQFSEGPTKERGGYLGAFEKEAMVKPFADKAFSMQAGEISDPVLTRFGWHIIKVEKVNAESTDSLETARAEIVDKLSTDQAKNIAFDEAEGLYDALYDDDKLAASAADRGFEVKQTDWVSRDSRTIEGLANGAKLIDAAFGLQPGEISEVIDLGDDYALVQVTEKQPVQTPVLEDVKTAVTEDLKAQKQMELAEKAAREFLHALAGADADFAAICKQQGLEAKTSGRFKRSGAIPEIGNEPVLTEQAFALSDTNKRPKDIVKGADGYYVISFKQRSLPDAAGFEKEKAQLKQSLLSQKQRIALDAFMEQIRTRSEIVIAEGFLEPLPQAAM